MTLIGFVLAEKGKKGDYRFYKEDTAFATGTERTPLAYAQ